MSNDEITLEIYSSGTKPIYDVSGELLNGRGLWWETFFPGGKFGAGGVFIPREKADNWWEVKGALRVVIRYGYTIVYEGKIPNLQHRMTSTDEGVYIEFMGMWGYDLMSRLWRKRWADDRVDESTWAWMTDIATYLATDKCTIGRRDRLRFLPKSEAWAAADFAAVQYVQPYGQTTKRITFDFELDAVAGEDWTASLFDVTNTSTDWSVNQAGAGSSSGSVDINSTDDFTAHRTCQIRLTSTGASTPVSNGQTFLNITNLVIYSEDESTGDDITFSTVAADVIATFTTLINSSTVYLHTPGTPRAIVPFMTPGDSFQYFGNTLLDAVAPGDGDDNNISVGLLASDSVASPDGKPVLYTSEYPDVDAGYDWIIYPDGKNIASDLVLDRDYDGFFNAIHVQWTNKDGIQKYIYPDETTSLKDTTSITANGRRDLLISIGNQTATTAQEIGEKFLAARKDPPWIASSITIAGSILDEQGQNVPVARFTACDSKGNGQRLKIDGYDTFIVSRARYDLTDNLVDIDFGQIQDPIVGNIEFATEWNDEITGLGESGGASASSNRPRNRLAYRMGGKKMRQMQRDWKRRGVGDWMKYKRAGQDAYRREKGKGRVKKYRKYLED